MLRLVSSTSAAVGAIASPKIRFITPIANALRESPILSDHRHFSTDSGNLIARKITGAIQSQIKAHELALAKNSRVPADLPFTIEDSDSDRHITLTRDFGDEKIKVTVNPVRVLPETENNAANDKKDKLGKERYDANTSQSVGINVSISKENKGTLDIGVNASTALDGFFVKRISFTEPNALVPSLTYDAGPWNSLGFGLRQFVIERGIEPSSADFLYDYMVEKRKRWGTVWVKGKKPADIGDLKKLKKFFEDWNQSSQD